MAEEIICLGKKFNSDDERREYFRNELRKKLSELKHIDGFPIGEDEDIIALSDPPYYTACPNPWMNDFIRQWEEEKTNLIESGIRNIEFNVSEPYAVDVTEGKNNPIYNAHSYHTKVPHPVIMRYILHYTQPGDIVLDSFAGTGMTGIAAQMCGDPEIQTKYKIEKEFYDNNLATPKWYSRKAICGDLSPAASFIAANYNTPIDLVQFKKDANRIIEKLENELGWMYQTRDQYGNIGRINYTVWSDVFLCKECNEEFVFWDVAFDKNTGSILDSFKCPHCNAKLSKREIKNAYNTVRDLDSGEILQQIKTVPVLINYFKQKKRFEKIPNNDDLETINRINNFDINNWIPTERMPEGDESRRNDVNGYTNINHFFTRRNLIVLSYLRELCTTNSLLLVFNSISQTLASKLVRYNLGNRGNGPLSGTLYIGSLTAESNVINIFRGKVEDLLKAFSNSRRSIIFTSSATNQILKNDSIDYIFTDPPFGANIMYSELNFMWESWLKVKTNNKKEAIENSSQGKSKLIYQNLMTECFSEYFRILKPGRWMTVEFSNTSAAIWNGIQAAIQKAGFIISNVTALDKQQGSFKAVTTPTAVKQDLIISCYKPDSDYISIYDSRDEKGIWEFVTDHLKHLPVHLRKESNTAFIIERSPKILYDRLISHFIIRGLPIPIDAKEFQLGLKQKYHERDGMYFIQEQVHEYDEKKAQAPTIIEAGWQIATESEGIEWLKRELHGIKLKYQDIMPKWMQATTAIRKGDILPELRDILQQNFIEESDGNWRVPDMNEAKDREIIRNKALQREFSSYVELANNPKSKRMKEVRVEALRAGFKNCWDTKDFQTVVNIANKIPQNLLMEDEQLLMYYDIAKDRV